MTIFGIHCCWDEIQSAMTIGPLIRDAIPCLWARLKMWRLR